MSNLLLKVMLRIYMNLPTQVTKLFNFLLYIILFMALNLKKSCGMPLISFCNLRCHVREIKEYGLNLPAAQGMKK